MGGGGVEWSGGEVLCFMERDSVADDTGWGNKRESSLQSLIDMTPTTSCRRIHTR